MKVLKRRILLTWLGRHDLDADTNNHPGPIGSILLESDAPFDEVRILANDWFSEISRYEKWLTRLLTPRKRVAQISFRKVKLVSPIDYPSIYDVAREELEQFTRPDALVTLNLSSGTPAMTANWLLLGKGVYNANLVQTSLQSGLSAVDLPFNIALAYLDRQDGLLGAMAASPPDVDAHFEHIQTYSVVMKEVVDLVKKLATRNLPVIILGESGTGKEVIAEAIHKASPRSRKPFIAINCGAIPGSLIDSQLFGHRKGSFTGADSDRKGFFDEANGGTLFLDEVGELPLEAQAKLLRALQQKEITPVGATKPHSVDIRVIAATHRDLLAMLNEGSFREDLFYRLAVGVVHLPPLRERHGDIPELTSALMDRLNEDAKDQPSYSSKKISKNAIKFIESQPWPGNIRELWNTLMRASIWSDDDTLEVEHLERAMIQRPQKSNLAASDIDVARGVDINKILDNTKRYCIEEALRLTAGQKGQAAKLLGLNSHQTLGNWMKQLGIEDI